MEDKLDEDLIEALAALSLPKAMYDARTLHLAMKVSCFLQQSLKETGFSSFDFFARAHNYSTAKATASNSTRKIPYDDVAVQRSLPLIGC